MSQPLKSLDLSNSANISYQELNAIRHSDATVVDLSGCSIDDDTIRLFKGYDFPNVVSLNVSRNQLATAKSMDILTTSFKGLQQLDLSNNEIKDIRPLKPLARKLKQLTSLKLAGNKICKNYGGHGEYVQKTFQLFDKEAADVLSVTLEQDQSDDDFCLATVDGFDSVGKPARAIVAKPASDPQKIVTSSMSGGDASLKQTTSASTGPSTKQTGSTPNTATSAQGSSRSLVPSVVAGRKNTVPAVPLPQKFPAETRVAADKDSIAVTTPPTSHRSPQTSSTSDSLQPAQLASSFSPVAQLNNATQNNEGNFQNDQNGSAVNASASTSPNNKGSPILPRTRLGNKNDSPNSDLADNGPTSQVQLLSPTTSNADEAEDSEGHSSTERDNETLRQPSDHGTRPQRATLPEETAPDEVNDDVYLDAEDGSEYYGNEEDEGQFSDASSEFEMAEPPRLIENPASKEYYIQNDWINAATTKKTSGTVEQKKAYFDRFVRDIENHQHFQQLNIKSIPTLFHSNVDSIETAFAVVEAFPSTIAQYARRNAPLPASTCVALMKGVVENVDELHVNGFVHNDCLLTNFVGQVDTGGQTCTRMIDFESCKKIENPSDTMADIQGIGGICLDMIGFNEATLTVRPLTVENLAKHREANTINQRFLPFVEKCLAGESTQVLLKELDNIPLPSQEEELEVARNIIQVKTDFYEMSKAEFNEQKAARKAEKKLSTHVEQNTSQPAEMSLEDEEESVTEENAEQLEQIVTLPNASKAAVSSPNVVTLDQILQWHASTATKRVPVGQTVKQFLKSDSQANLAFKEFRKANSLDSASIGNKHKKAMKAYFFSQVYYSTYSAQELEANTASLARIRNSQEQILSTSAGWLMPQGRKQTQPSTPAVAKLTSPLLWSSQQSMLTPGLAQKAAQSTSMASNPSRLSQQQKFSQLQLTAGRSNKAHSANEVSLSSPLRQQEKRPASTSAIIHQPQVAPQLQLN